MIIISSSSTVLRPSLYQTPRHSKPASVSPLAWPPKYSVQATVILLHVEGFLALYRFHRQFLLFSNTGANEPYAIQRGWKGQGRYQCRLGVRTGSFLEHADLTLSFEEKRGCDQMERRKKCVPRGRIRTPKA